MAEHVCAIVVTYSRKEMLRECVAALQAQTRAVDTILVVDNASTDGTAAMVHEEFPGVEVLELLENAGGAGGFHAGMKWALERGFDWQWLMDDDAFAAPECLETLLNRAADSAAADKVLVPLQKNKLGYSYGVTIWNGNAVEVTEDVLAGRRPLVGEYMFSFVGPLIARTIVEKIGLPHENFFIYFDDWEYALRIHKKTDAEIIVVPEAEFRHDIGGKAREAKLLWRKSVRVTPAPWKLYYGARNAVWTLAHGGRPRHELYKYLSYQVRWNAGDLIYERDGLNRVLMRARGIFDGMTNRMGQRVPPGASSAFARSAFARSAPGRTANG